VQRDVAISTAIGNGARFPWISPAGTLTGQDGARGHILDGGYFDAAGVATLGELARAIAALPERTDRLHFIFLFIGYEGATEDSRPSEQQVLPQHLPTAEAPTTTSLASSPPPAPPEEQQRTARFLNETGAPLTGLFASRTAHEAHIMNVFRQAPALPAGVTAEFIPVMLCKDDVEGKPFEPPMDWALSTMARAFIHAALGTGPNPPCSHNGASTNSEALEKITHLIAR
jgi:hypothetical protein